MNKMDGTTIVAVRKNGKSVIAGDGQATAGNVVIKGNVVKVRRIYNDKVVIGFAGGVADAFALSARFEELLQKFSGNLMRSAVELATGFREDKYARHLEAQMLVADKDRILLVSGGGEVLDPEHGVIAIGSGGNYAYAAALALFENTDMDATDIARKAMKIAGDICVYTNHNVTLEEV